MANLKSSIKQVEKDSLKRAINRAHKSKIKLLKKKALNYITETKDINAMSSKEVVSFEQFAARCARKNIISQAYFIRQLKSLNEATKTIQSAV